MLLGIILLSLFLRLFSAFYLGNDIETLPGVFDQVSYHNLALRVVEGHGFSFGENWWPATRAGEPTAHWSFIYTLFLAGVYKFFGANPLAARIIQSIIVAIVHPWLIWRIGRRLFGEKTALIAALITAVYSYFVYYAGALMTESFYIIALLWAIDIATLLAAEKPHEKTKSIFPWIGLGIALGCAILLRQVFLFFTPVLFLWLFFTFRKKNLTWIACRGIMTGCLVIAFLIIPWTIRNYSAFGRFVLINTNAGFAFFWGNNPIHGTDFIPILHGSQSYGSLIPERLHNLNEAALESELLKEGINFVRNDPIRYLKLSLSRTKEYFRFWPSGESTETRNLARIFSFGLFLPFMAFGIVAVSVRRIREYLSTGRDTNAHTGHMLILLFIFVYTMIHLLTWTLIRYRLPVDSILTIYAGYAVFLLSTRFRRGWFLLSPRSNAPLSTLHGAENSVLINPKSEDRQL